MIEVDRRATVEGGLERTVAQGTAPGSSRSSHGSTTFRTVLGIHADAKVCRRDHESENERRANHRTAHRAGHWDRHGHRGHDVCCYCEVLAPVDIEDSLAADLVGMSGTTLTQPNAYRPADEFETAGVPVVLGGSHVTFMADRGARTRQLRGAR